MLAGIAVAALLGGVAGEQGKGFAVVADQVRNLADQSKEATAQVQCILNEIQKATNAAEMHAGQGSTVVEAGAELGGWATSSASLSVTIEQSSIAAEQIAAAGQQQTRAWTRSPRRFRRRAAPPPSSPPAPATPSAWSAS